MRRVLAKLAFGACAAMFAQTPSRAQTPPPITLTRLDCGTNAPPTDVGARFSDTYAYNGLKVQLTFSCYLIRHGDDYMIWDTGNPVGRGADRAENEPGGPARAAEAHAGADQVRRHQSLSRRSHGTGELCSRSRRC